MRLFLLPFLLLGSIELLYAEHQYVELRPDQKTFTFSSHGYPNPAPADLDQSWSIYSPTGTIIRLKCYDIRLIQDHPPACDQDILMIDDGARLSEVICGSHYDTKYFTSVNRLEVRLITGAEQSGGVQCTAETLSRID